MDKVIHSAISLTDLEVGYRGRGLFNKKIDLEIPAATLNILMGANGSGKSTLLHTISGSLQPVAGQIRLLNKNISELSHRKLAQMLSIVYTERITAGGLTVTELVQMGRQPYTGFTGRLSGNDKEIAEAAIEDVGIIHKKDSFLSDISDGERQKAMIARALAQQTPVMLLDEPTNFLDAASRLEVLGLIHNLVEERGITVLLSTHDIAAALSMADNVITVLPHADIPVQINEVRSDEAINRLRSVFDGHNVEFDVEIGDFVLRSK